MVASVMRHGGTKRERERGEMASHLLLCAISSHCGDSNAFLAAVDTEQVSVSQGLLCGVGYLQ
jgi:hypothetical protein